MAGLLTLANFRTELTYLLEGRAGIGDARLDRWVNQIYRHISMPTIHKHWELELGFAIPLVENQYAYSLSTVTQLNVPANENIDFNISGIRYVKYNDLDNRYPNGQVYTRVLKRRSEQWMDNVAKVSSGGGPEYWGVLKNFLIIRPVPDATITVTPNQLSLEVWIEPAPLSADGDVTVLLPWWDEVILMGAKWLAETQLGFNEYAVQSQQAFLQLIDVAPDREVQGLVDDESLMMDMNSGEPYMDKG